MFLANVFNLFPMFATTRLSFEQGCLKTLATQIGHPIGLLIWVPKTRKINQKKDRKIYPSPDMDK